MNLSAARAAELAGTFLGVLGVVSLGVFQGLDVWSVAVEAADPYLWILDVQLPSVQLMFLESAAWVSAFTVIGLVVAVSMWHSVWRGSRPRTYLEDGPPVTAMVPGYRDAEVLDVSVESLLETDYEDVTVAMVVESGDVDTVERARDLEERYDDAVCLVNGYAGSKAGAINYAVDWSDDCYFAVFDVEERVSPEFLPRAMSELTGDADVFQGRRVPRPTGVVETLAYCERAAVGSAYNFVEHFGFTDCQSASTAFTRDALEEVGGFRDVLTEDIEFSHAVHREGLEVVNDRRCTNTMEAPHTFRDLWGQRKRWRIGQLQVFHNRVNETVNGGGSVDARKLTSLARAFGALAVGICLVLVAVHAGMLAASGTLSGFLTPYLVMTATVGVVWLKDMRDGRVGRPSLALALAPLVYLGHGVLTLKALLEYYLTWDGEWYHVAKSGG